ncbi:xanthine dehydrogenase accessory protein XdhC [Roseibium sediminicola]|uniref:Xanthine dehydrogenase accessory protein XdhC n=1 Tax=Roseibium sediminicola TaxID=2933272 RepID=A0ABT0GQA0_9HYPH|nr:xanthine dehydrogenase accessory protein XdhC [Roseibium sp. CAU 1639]MCK7611415.1 xanthine dehydrogenase accessory protein XdhC [Roseibium sp. CAU 1639]
MRVWANITDCLERDGACALVTVARVDGSTPREAGARMVVRPDGSFHGTIGGGTLEFEAIRKAVGALRGDNARFFLQSVSLGPDLGQCCGGRAQIAIETMKAGMLGQARRFAALEAKGTAFTTRVQVGDGRAGERTLHHEPSDQLFTLKDDEKGGEALLIEQFGTDRRPLFLFGAGHVGRALVLALAPLPFEIFWIDSRAEQFPGPVPANVRKIAVKDPAAQLDEAPDGAFVLAMTHSHALDEEIMARALLQQRFAYCGVIGSATKRARFQKRMKSRGLNETLIANMVCPVGVTALKSKHPAAIAAGVAVDLMIRDEASHQQAAAGGRLAHN